MKRTFSVLSVLILGACGGSEKTRPIDAAAGATPTLSQADEEARKAEAAAWASAQVAKTKTAVEEAAARKEAAAAEEKRAAAEAAYLKTPGGKIWAKHRDWSDATCEMIAKRHVFVGMTAEQMRASWGAPDHINSTITANRRHEQWVYGSSQYVYFDDGVMTSLQTSR